MNKVHRLGAEPKVEDLLASIRRAIGEDDIIEEPSRIEPRFRGEPPRIVHREENKVARLGNPPFRTVSRERVPEPQEAKTQADLEEIEELRNRIVREISAHELQGRMANAISTITPVPMAEARPTAQQKASLFKNLLGGPAEDGDESMFEPHDASLPPFPPAGLRGSLADGDGVHLRAVPDLEPAEATMSPAPAMQRGPRPAAAQARPPFGQGKAGIRPFAPTPEPPGMVSRETAAEAMQSFQKLTDEILGSADGGGRLDELARELLRPMLKQWLDQNLSGIVEALVREEIERVSRRSRR
jgi:cell pole-organizing protein PopZ